MDFKYTVNDEDPTIEEVKMDETFYKYDKTVLQEFDNSYKDLYESIINDDEVVVYYLYPKNNFDKKYIKNSINLWNDLGITLHNINIFKVFRNINSYKEVNKRFLKSFYSDNPSKLSLKTKNILQWDSKCYFLESDSDIVFKNIVIPKLDKKCASTIYAHEIAHTQLLTRNGGTNSIFNEETIPILMEHIFAEELDKSKVTANFVRCERLVSLAKFINNLDLKNLLAYNKRVECEKYIISSLQAIKISNIYSNGNNSTKKEILKDINKVFNGDLITEDLLNKYEAYYKDVDKDIKKLKLTR